MQIRKLLREDDAVSPVIGVILMVAITVILAAVIASFVLGLGGSQQSTPTASFSWDYTEADDSGTNDVVEGVAELSHDGGDSIVASELFVRGDGLIADTDPDYSNVDYTSGDIDVDDGTNKDNVWPDDEATGSQGSSSAVVGGNTINIAAGSAFDLSLVWEPAEGDTSATLSQETGPDA